MKSNYLVCYDIASPRRLGRILRLMKGNGIHIQYSVFFCRFTWPQLLEIKRKLNLLINPKEDDIRIYPLPAGEKTVALGRGDKVPEGVDVYL